MDGSERPATFPEFFTALLRSRNLSQRQAARLLKVSDSQVSRWQHGDGGISLSSIERIATTFGLDRNPLARLAGLRDSNPTTTEEPLSTTEIDLLVDAEAAELHAQLRGIPQLFWTAILTAQKVARQMAIDNARAAIELVSTPATGELAPPRRHRRHDDQPSEDTSREPLASSFAYAGAL